MIRLAPLEFKIITDTKEFQKDQKGQILRTTNSAKYFVTLVKLDPGKSPKDFMKFFDEADGRLARSRAARNIHEDLTFITMGRYDLVVVWHAPTADDAHQYINDLLALGVGDGASTETLSASGEVGT